ncbi:ABC-2 type transport system ATP-binding protein [Palleronia marisminoris]|uniref:Cobalt import ATP-binding protein CbiO n=1 Tax=Palleronia marisminoris TaxID=315423 RepID=A0A1Y5TLI1_9RHOB|nr:ABC transporter ATP-binding protein [Palleronia marisminoris]SFH43744.1 ABC-2 type transport system ATP-binding protein [Palleronia marisminoris]SLN66801.1 Cobalt import ATP-binding protein CbiO [Palleronia marisminoris]
MSAIVSVKNLSKRYEGGVHALKDVDLEIEEGEILALLGPNGAGKTTLISCICGMASITAGHVVVGGHDNVRDYRKARALIGLVPQEINLQPFETVMNTVRFTRGLFGKRGGAEHIERVLRSLSLWDKRDVQIRALSGGMKRRVLIAKALSHEPKVLFLDEPTAGVDVGLRKEMWSTVAELRAHGVTVILTTHYIEEAEAMADRIGIISGGEIKLVRDKAALMRELGRKRLVIELTEPAAHLPEGMDDTPLELGEAGRELTYTYDPGGDGTGITRLLTGLRERGYKVRDVRTEQSSLEDIFVDLTAGEDRT